jgi:hypothetical protein
MKLALISCGKDKRAGCHMAKDLYISDRFVLAWDYAKYTHDAVLILSAKHGLLDPYKTIRAYDMTLGDLSQAQRAAWSKKAAQAICDYSPDDSEVTFLCGDMYSRGIRNLLEGRTIATPFKGLRRGQQIKWLKSNMYT